MEDLRDLRSRLRRAEDSLQVTLSTVQQHRDKYSRMETLRLRGKIEGVRLALSYVEESLRDEPEPVIHYVWPSGAMAHALPDWQDPKHEFVMDPTKANCVVCRQHLAWPGHRSEG